MDTLKTYTPLVARILIAALFLIAGLGKLADVAGFTGFLTSGGLPAFLAWPSILFEILLGLSLIAGFQVRIMALLGAGFCVVAALLYHFVPADQMQMTMFFKNLAIAGGLLLLASNGAGALSLDARRAA
jgi:putative oxidoreductase